MINLRTRGEKCFDIFNVLLMLAIMCVMLYPILYIIFASFSDPMLVRTQGGLLLYPLRPTLDGYRIIFQGTDVWTGYKNTLFYVFVGTAINLSMTTVGAYVLSRRDFMLKNPIMMLIVFTMYFSGGMIPTYFVVKDLHLINNRMSLILPGAIATWNLIVMRTSFAALPEELEQSAYIDGANDWTILVRIVIPLSSAILAVMALFYAVGYWNTWFGAVLYLRDRSKYPLQMFLRELLILENTVTDPSGAATFTKDTVQGMLTKMMVKYSITVVATIPVLCVYPFLQKYFVKGVMIGSIKG